MSSRIGGVAAAAIIVATSAFAATPAPPKLGRPASPDEIARIDISIPPDGKGLPSGSGSVSQGAMVFAQKCAVCHGANAEGTPSGDRLVGGIGSLNSPNPVKTVASYWPYATTVFDYIRRAMPITNPQSLQNDEVYAVTAYVLSIDNIVAKDAVLDSQSLPKVQMPNRAGFVNWEPRLLKP
ncbi:MAG TPA: cytochrome c [Micropepsaceae bacterium]|jgi:cytochrome c|nr:cytochrome c [Micropepsaceae bacterium]